jgi:quinoprotein glucose dehydrogenase
MRNHHLPICVIFVCLLFSCKTPSPNKTWEVYGGSKENIRYSELNQIDTNNVKDLVKAWEYKTGDTDKYTQIQVNPIVIKNVLYGVSPKLKLFAIDASSGKSKWIFDPYKITEQGVKGVGYFAMNVCRGVTYFEDHKSARLFYASWV